MEIMTFTYTYDKTDDKSKVITRRLSVKDWINGLQTPGTRTTDLLTPGS